MRPKYRIEIPNPEYFAGLVSCMLGCPVGTDAGGYVQAIARGDDSEAYRLASSPNPLVSTCGRICAHPCEEVCRRAKLDAPVSIRALKRYATERCGAESPSYKVGYPKGPGGSQDKEARPEKVAVIGAGPAGLSCAYELASLGYGVTVFEAKSVPGGMLHLGIPEYRLARDLIRSEVGRIQDAGVKIRYEWALGVDFTIQDLLRDDYRAVFLGLGANKGRELSIPGRELDGVVNGIDFLLNVNLGYKVSLGLSVVVVGGGSVAFDVARTALRHQEIPGFDSTPKMEDGSTMIDAARAAIRLGAREVHVISLESREELPATAYEVFEGEREGIVLHPSRGPKRLLGESGTVKAIETLKVASIFDDEGRFNPTFVAGSEEALEADTVILAIGQQPDRQALRYDPVEWTDWGTIKIDPDTLATSMPGVYAGGDLAFGPRIVINAVQDGRVAARSIDEHLHGSGPSGRSCSFAPWKRERPLEPFDRIDRAEPPLLPTDRRVGFKEVELGYDEKQARTEAQRCLACHVNTVFDSAKCIMCGGCVDACPEYCLKIVPISHLEDDPGLQGLKSSLNLQADQSYAMIKNEDICIRCSLCARRCPTDAISMEFFTWRGNWR